MALDEKKIEEYLNSSKSIVLATVNSKKQPEVRTLGGFVAKGLITYFSTSKQSNKVKQIEENSEVGLLFQHEDQIIPQFINVAINGIAEKIESPEEYKIAVEYIKTRRPQLQATKETHNIYKVIPKQIKILDFSKEKLEDRLEVISL